jgi:hypothetical protein
LAIASPTNAPSVRIFRLPFVGLERLALLDAERHEHRHKKSVAVLYRLMLDHRRELLPIFHSARHG